MVTHRFHEGLRVAYREDDGCVRPRQSGNLTLLLDIALSILQQETAAAVGVETAPFNLKPTIFALRSCKEELCTAQLLSIFCES